MRRRRRVGPVGLVECRCCRTRRGGAIAPDVRTVGVPLSDYLISRRRFAGVLEGGIREPWMGMFRGRADAAAMVVSWRSPFALVMAIVALVSTVDVVSARNHTDLDMGVRRPSCDARSQGNHQTWAGIGMYWARCTSDPICLASRSRSWTELAAGPAPPTPSSSERSMAKLETVVSDELVDWVIETIQRAAFTGRGRQRQGFRDPSGTRGSNPVQESGARGVVTAGVDVAQEDSNAESMVVS